MPEDQAAAYAAHGHNRAGHRHSGGGPSTSSKVECNWCHRLGHIESECRTKTQYLADLRAKRQSGNKFNNNKNFNKGKVFTKGKGDAPRRPTQRAATPLLSPHAAATAVTIATGTWTQLASST